MVSFNSQGLDIVEGHFVRLINGMFFDAKDDDLKTRIIKWIERLEKQHRQLTGAKARLGQQMDSLDIMDKFYEKKYQDMETRLYRLYDEIEGVENSIEEVKNRLLNIRQQKISEENVYQFLLYFDKLYDKFTDLEKKEFLNSFVEQVDIYDQEQPDGRFLKHIKFRFPVYFGDRETQELCWDNESTVETVWLLSKLSAKQSQCPPEKEKAIMEEFEYFGMI